MEGREGMSSGGGGGVAVMGENAAARSSENPSNQVVVVVGSTASTTTATTATTTVTTASATPVSVGLGGTTAVKKKRGRPRKYGPDRPVSTLALSPMPISASAPPPPQVSRISGEKQQQQRGRGRPSGVLNKIYNKVEIENLGDLEKEKQGNRWWGLSGGFEESSSSGDFGVLLTFCDIGPRTSGLVGGFVLSGILLGKCLQAFKFIMLDFLTGHGGEWVSCSSGLNFTPHVITVAAGEDVTMKIISFSQQGPRAICILSANGAISNVTLRQPDSSGGTLTYEGRFEILSLSGSFMPTESGGTRSRSGGMSVSLASPDGRVVGGGVAGLLVAATPVQVVVGSFLPCTQQEPKPKKQKVELSSATSPTMAVPISSADMEEGYNGQGQRSSSTPKPTLAPSSSFHGDSWATLHSMQEPRNQSSTDINVSLREG
ncbi:hypothetical protein Sjap_020817 [Stephania japonica]|uniref:AT-hook motif nuclear-localized protein n=1 Tax=Stephania japonica TaxID=461633 RepID=A0AAP0F6Q1_9MAGN